MNGNSESISTHLEDVGVLQSELKDIVHLLEDESIGLDEVLILCNRLLITRQKIEKLIL